MSVPPDLRRRNFAGADIAEINTRRVSTLLFADGKGCADGLAPVATPRPDGRRAAPVPWTIPLVLAGAILSAVAQEPAGPEPGGAAVAADVAEDTLMVAEPLPAGDVSAAEAVGEPVALIEAGAAGRRGRWRVAPHFDVTGTYDDNIFIKSANKVADYILTLAPGVALGFWDEEEERERYLARQHGASVIERRGGSFLMVDYTAILLGFARTSSQNAFDHDARFAWRWNVGKLTVGGDVHAESKSETNADVGGRIRRRTLTAEVRASYDLTAKTALEIALFNIHNDPENYVRTVEWRGEAYAGYAVTPLVKLGLGVAAGRVNVEGGDDRTFEQVFTAVAYSLGEKLEVGARGGVEFRQSDGPSGDAASPIFELRATWVPAEETRVGLEAFRRVETSALQANQDILLTGVALTFQRELRAGFHFIFEGGYQVSEYTEGGGGADRTDRYYFVRPGLLYNFAHWGNARVTYAHRSNDSNRSASSFDNNQITVQVSLIY